MENFKKLYSWTPAPGYDRRDLHAGRLSRRGAKLILDTTEAS